jgi:hypothetical protein
MINLGFILFSLLYLKKQQIQLILVSLFQQLKYQSNILRFKIEKRSTVKCGQIFLSTTRKDTRIIIYSTKYFYSSDASIINMLFINSKVIIFLHQIPNEMLLFISTRKI